MRRRSRARWRCAAWKPPTACTSPVGTQITVRYPSSRCCSQTLRPAKIECPGYEPSSERGADCRQIIQEYEARTATSNRPAKLRYITPEYIDGLEIGQRLAFRNVFYTRAGST